MTADTQPSATTPPSANQLDVLCHRLFGKRSEEVDPRQLRLALEQLANDPGLTSEPVEMFRLVYKWPVVTRRAEGDLLAALHYTYGSTSTYLSKPVKRALVIAARR